MTGHNEMGRREWTNHSERCSDVKLAYMFN
jgi:hypothetical protein